MGARCACVSVHTTFPDLEKLVGIPSNDTSGKSTPAPFNDSRYDL